MKLYLLLYCLLITSTAFAQPSGNFASKENAGLQPAWVHFDKPFYCVDESLGFSLFLAPEFTGQPFLMQAILFNAQGEPVHYSYWPSLGQSRIAGRIYVPFNLNTGWYYFSFRAWDDERQRERVLLQAPVAVYHPTPKIEMASVSSREPQAQSLAVDMPKRALQVGVQLTGNGPIAGRSQAVTITVADGRGRPVAADVSVSINDWGLMGTAQAMGMRNLVAGDSLQVIVPGNLREAPYWQGSLVDEQDQVIKNQTINWTWGYEQNTTTTDARGRFLATAPYAMELDRLAYEHPGLEGNHRIQFYPTPGRLAIGPLNISPAAMPYLTYYYEAFLLGAFPEKTYYFGNIVGPHMGMAPIIGTDEKRVTHWRASTDSPINPASLVWDATLRTDNNGNLQLNYQHGWEHTAYRIDVVVQDEEGRRGRGQLIYRVE